MKKSNERVDNIIKLYKEGYSLNDISVMTKYGCPNTIRKVLKDNNVQLRSRTHKHKAIINNEDFFEVIDTEEKAYFLGLIIADGNVYRRNKENSQNCFRIELSRGDKYILENLRECLGLNLEVKDTRKNCCKLSVCSNKIFNDLNAYGVVPNKTSKERFVYLDKSLMNHFIRGFFDGDGWITTPLTKNKKKRRKIIGFCGNNEFLQNLMDYIYEELNIPTKKITDRKTISLYSYGSQKDVEKIIEYLYRDATVYLDRKKEKCYSSIVNTEVN